MATDDTPADHPDLTSMTAAEVRRMALTNIAQRARDGKQLSDADWQRIAEAEAAGRPDPLAEPIAQIRAQADELREQGKRVPAGLTRLLRETMLREVGQHVWADVPAAAKELGVSVQTIRNWCDEAGLQHKRCAISKAELYRALWLREREQVQTGGLSPADKREQELRIQERQARIDAKTGRLVEQANDSARAGVIAAVRDLRGGMLDQLPARLADRLAGDGDRIVWEGDARRVIRDHLTDLCEELGPAKQSELPLDERTVDDDPDPDHR